MHTNEGMKVALVAPGFPAEKAGRRKDEVVTAINGIRIGGNDDVTKRPRLELFGRGDRVTFQMSDGSTRELVLADYF